MMSTAGVVLPKQIQDQLDAAERLMQPQDPEPAPVAVEPPSPEPAPQPEPQPEPAPTPAPAAPAEPQQDAEYWRQRFKTLEGVERTETIQLRRQLQETQAQLNQLVQRFQQPTPQPSEPQPDPLITPKDEEAFGADLIDAMRRSAREVIRTESRDLLKRLATLEQALGRVAPQVERVAQVEQQVAQTREQTFWGELSRAVPDWQAVNDDPKWHAWLDEVEPLTGVTRQALLNDAQQKLDHRRVATMFTLFKQTLPAPAAQPSGPNPELARQVAPSKSSTATPTPSQPKVFTSREYQYWTDPRRAHDTDKVALSKMLDQLERAEVEGRIDWTK